MTRPIRAALFLASLLGAAGLGAGAMSLVRGRPAAATGAGDPRERQEGPKNELRGLVTLSPTQQKAAGIAIEPARRGPLTLTKRVTGKISSNEDRLAHIYSLVEGIVHEVKIGYGGQAQQGDVLALIDSREVGQAKLTLVQNRLSARIARVNLDWKQTIADNTRALLEAMEKKIAPQEISEQFRDRPMGKYREDLVSAYARLLQLQVEYERYSALVERQSVSESSFEKAKADFEAGQATCSALKEQTRFTTEQELIQAQQALEQAQVAEGASRSSLYILGYSEAEVNKMDPLQEGEEVAHYAIKAPFDGTILAKDVVVQERVGPQTKLFDLANLATVWVQADIFEKDLDGLADAQDRAIRFSSAAYPGRSFEARVFSTGNVVDPATRTVRLMAVADNPAQLLKPGLFVEVELPTGTAADVVQVPKSAIQNDAGATFVFVQSTPGAFARRAVTLGREGTDVVEVVQGLRGGEPIVVRGAFTLKSELKRGELSEGGD